MKLNDLEKKILFDAITMWKKANITPYSRLYGTETDSAVSSLRSKLKKALNEQPEVQKADETIAVTE